MRYNDLVPTIWFNVHADEPPAPGAPPAPAPPAPGAPPAPAPGAPPPPAGPDGVKVFSQADVDRIVKNRLRKQEEAQKILVGEVNALKAKSDLTTEERSDWEKRLEQLNNTLLSEQQLGEKETKRKADEHEEALKTKDTQITKWEDLYTTSQIKRSISDAAIEHKAFHPEQIESILDRKTRLVEELADGKPTGRLVPRVRFEDVDDKGKPVTLDISPLEAVKRMTEIGKYQNLFEGKGTGGVGTRSHAEGGKKQNLATVAKDPAAWLKGRRDGTITLD